MQAFKAITAAILLMLWAAVSAAPQESTSERAIKALEDFFKFDVPYVPTPPEVVKTMLKLAGAGPDDTVYDLGSGDGRIVIAAVRDFGVKKGVGIDLDQDLINRALQTAVREGVDGRAEFHISDIFTTDFSDATVMTLYLLEKINVQLRPRILDELNPGTRVVSHHFSMGDWSPDAERNEHQRRIYMWIVPAKVAGIWTWTVEDQAYRLELEQKYQKVSGTLHGPSGTAKLRDLRVRGSNLNFETDLRGCGASIPIYFKGNSAGEVMDAVFELNGQAHHVVANRLPQ